MIIDDDVCFDEGVSGKMSTETAHDDDNFGTESSQKVRGPNNHHSQLIYNEMEFCMCFGCFDFYIFLCTCMYMYMIIFLSGHSESPWSGEA